jgi:hypothetical protein
MLGTEGSDSWRSGMRAEINDHLPLPYDRLEIVALINLSNHLQFWFVGRASKEGPPHAALGTSDDDFCHA